MNAELDFTDFLDELGEVADWLFEALKATYRLRDRVEESGLTFSSRFSEQHWEQLPSNIRLCVLELVYATYFGGEETSEALIQWRKDIYNELDVSTPPTKRLRKVK